MCLAIDINDVPRRSHQTMKLFAAPPRRTAPFGIGMTAFVGRNYERMVHFTFVNRVNPLSNVTNSSPAACANAARNASFQTLR